MIKADSIIYGKIITLDTDKLVVDAMVVKDKRIVYLGSKEIAETMRGENTEILDYGDNVIYPGFMDAHTHGPMAGERLALQADLADRHCMQDYIDIMAQYVKDNPDKKVYLGSGWDKFEEPTAAMLDAICPDKPMALRTSDGHSMWLNTAALKDCGIDKEYAKEMGAGQVHVDDEGNPTGLICELPVNKVSGHYAVTLEDMKQALLAWQEFAFSQGITAVGEALLDLYPCAADAYKELINEGKWKLRTYAYPANMDIAYTRPEDCGARIKEMAEEYDSEYLKIVGQKIVLDGVVEAHTAAMLDEYDDQPGYYGELNIKDEEKLKKLVASVNEAGFSVHTHAIGDKACKMIMDAYQEVETEFCNFDIRNVVCHLQCVRPEDIKRIADYNIVAVVPPTWPPVTHPAFDDCIKYLGTERAWDMYPVKSFEDAGATICFHTDYPINVVMNVPLSVYTAVKRALPKAYPGGIGGPQSVMNPDEALSPLRALLAMTANIAYMCKCENDLGTLQIGKIANATVYTRDFINYDDPEEIVQAELVATIVDGKVVYKA